MRQNDFIEQLEKRYEDYLKSQLTGKALFPLKLRGGKSKPDSTVQLHESIRVFQKNEKKPGGFGWTIDWGEWKSKKLGNQKWPIEVVVDTDADYLWLIGKESEVVLFQSLCARLLNWRPTLKSLFSEEPLLILQHQDQWNALILVIDYCINNNLNSFYLRNIPVSVHTKYIEENRTIIRKLLSFLDSERFQSIENDLELYLGVTKKPKLFAARWLDSELARLYNNNRTVFAITASDLRNVEWHLKEIWIVENETSLFMLPEKKNTLVICGSGKAVELLNSIPLFQKNRLVYWGDMDEDGFLILSNFRSNYPNLLACMMDEETLNSHIDFIEKQPAKYKTSASNHFLLPHEFNAFEKLKIVNGRLEQERLEMSYITQSVLNF